jgi:hypothetical protein
MKTCEWCGDNANAGPCECPAAIEIRRLRGVLTEIYSLASDHGEYAISGRCRTAPGEPEHAYCGTCDKVHVVTERLFRVCEPDDCDC